MNKRFRRLKTSIVIFLLILSSLNLGFVHVAHGAFNTVSLVTTPINARDGDVEFDPALWSWSKNTAGTEFAWGRLAGNKIRRGWTEWDISGIGTNVTITKAVLIYVGDRNLGNIFTWIKNVTIQASVIGSQALYYDIGNGTLLQEEDTTFPVFGAQKNITLNKNVRDALQHVLDIGQTWFALGYMSANESTVVDFNTIEAQEHPAVNPAPTLYLEYYDGKVCIPDSVEILNPSAYDEDWVPWVYTDEKFYLFNATYENYNNTLDDLPQIRFSPDGVDNVYVRFRWYTDINGLWETIDINNYVDVPDSARIDVAVFYNETTLDLELHFPIWFNGNTPDAQDVEIYMMCSSDVGWVDAEYRFHIYNDGELIEKTTTGNASFTEGGKWFVGCVFGNGTLHANMTYRKIQSFKTQYALRFYENVSGVFVPEDQFMQTYQHSGGGAEKWGNIFDWIINWKIWVWDNSTLTWVRVAGLAMWMGDGDEGATSEWIGIATQPYSIAGSLDTKIWNSFIEEEPAARTRHWFDVWIDKMNASSYIGFRPNAYFYGMESTPWLIWQGWSPQLDNSTEDIRYVPILHADSSVFYARYIDLMKIEFEIEFYDDYTASDPYMVCVEDINIHEVKVQDPSLSLEGVSIPIYNPPKVPDMPIGGILAPLYAAIMAFGKLIVDSLSGAADLIWGVIRSYAPWFTDFWDTVGGMIVQLADLFSQIGPAFLDLIEFLGDTFWIFGWFVDLITDTWSMVSGWLGVFTENAGNWVVLAIIIFGVLPWMKALFEGDTSFMENDLRRVWGILSTIIDYTYRFVSFVVNAILEAIPL